MAVRITGVDLGSPAREYKILPGDELVSINGEEINDMMDLQFYSADTDLHILLRRGGENVKIRLQKEDVYTPLGLEFETYLIDKHHSCKNKCIFSLTGRKNKDSARKKDTQKLYRKNY